MRTALLHLSLIHIFRKDVEAGDAMVPMDQIKVIQDDETDTAAHKSEWLDECKELFTE